MKVIESVIFDTSNILHENSSYLKAIYNNYLLVRDAINNLVPNVQIISIADPKTRHKIDQYRAYELLCRSGEIIQAPYGEKADYYILEYLKSTHNSVVISNDAFRNYNLSKSKYARIIPYKIILGKVIFSEKLFKILYKNVVNPFH